MYKRVQRRTRGYQTMAREQNCSRHDFHAHRTFSRRSVQGYMQLQTEQPSTDERCVTPTLEKCVPNTLLNELGITKSADLTPKAKCLYTKVRSLQNTTRIYKKRAVALKERLKLAKKMFVASNNDSREDSIKFYMQQLLKKSGPPQGRRYMAEEKLMCLTLYKSSGSAYRVLSKWFNLPCQRTMARVLQRIPLKAGINEFVFTHLKKRVDKMKSREKLCFIMFDEIALLPHVEYKKHEDVLLGMENGVIVDHALVFIVKGILTNWKQSVAYTFCKGTLTTANLKTNIVNHYNTKIDYNWVKCNCNRV